MAKIAAVLVLAVGVAVPLSGQTPSGTRVAADHLVLTSRLSTDAVAPGSAFSLVLDVVPKAGLHVYAPGAGSYKVVTFTPEANSLLDVKPLQYPPSEIYFFKPLNERVPVFQKPFTLTLPITLRPGVKGNSVEVKGVLDYQACNDTICFTPKQIRVSHVIRIKT